MQDRATPSGCGMESVARRDLDVVGHRRIEGALAADPHHGAAVADDGLHTIRRAPWRFGNGWRHELWRALDLADVEQREGAKQRDALGPFLPAVSGIAAIVTHLQPLEEVGGGAALALLDLPAAVGSLLVGGPPRIAAAEGERRHAEHDRVDPPVAGAGDRVARHGGTAGLVGVPGLAPRRGTGFEGGNHPVGDVSVVVAPLRLAAAALCLVAHG